MSRLRILLLGPDCNPEGVSIPFVTYSHAAALSPTPRCHLGREIDRMRTLCAAQRRRFVRIEVIRMPWLERIYAWSFRRIFKSNFASQAVTAFGYPFALAFEWFAWRQLRQTDLRWRIRRRSAPGADDGGVAESFRFLPAEGTDTLRDWADQWRTPFCEGFQSGR